MAANRSAVRLRLFRLARRALHLRRGLAIAWLRYPKLTEAQRQTEKRRWSRTLLSILSVSVREKNSPKELPDSCMLVLNHISWLDVFVIDARFPRSEERREGKSVDLGGRRIIKKKKKKKRW